MQLSDRDIANEVTMGGLRIEPLPGPGAFQPASIEVHIDWDAAAEVVAWTLEPGEFRLFHTFEKVTVPDYLVLDLKGKSSWGRLGLLIHLTAGLIDPGFSGQITLELKNAHHEEAITIPRYAAIGQLTVHRLSSPCLRPYGTPELNSHYQGQTGTTPSYLEPSPMER